MSDETKIHEEIDPGEPIGPLANFEYDTSSDFLNRIRRSIYRRVAVSQVATFSWNAPFLIFLEFWLTLADHVFPKTSRKDQ